MPSSAPTMKIEGVRRFGGKVTLVEGGVGAALDAAARYAAETGALSLHPFDSEDVVDGNAVIGREIGRSHSDADVVVAANGGGGLNAGLARSLPDCCQVLGAEPAVMPSASAALRAGHPVDVPLSPSVADGAMVRRIGTVPFQVLSRDARFSVHGVREDAIKAAIRLLYVEEGLRVEGAGALPLGLMIERPNYFAGKKVVLVLSGTNIDDAPFARIVG